MKSIVIQGLALWLAAAGFASGTSFATTTALVSSAAYGPDGNAAAVETQADLAAADVAQEAERADLIKHARAASERGLSFNRGGDHVWWLAAQARLLDDDFSAAVEAGQAALLLSPSWPRLPQRTRVELGLEPQLVDALRRNEGFRRLWDSLAIRETVQ